MITQDRLKELLHYDPETGAFTWKDDRKGRVKKGAEAGRIAANGYVRITIDIEEYYAHRLAWICQFGHFPDCQIDHINHVRHDNRIENLRSCTHQENHRNMPITKRNTSGIVGVGWNKKLSKWQSLIMADGKNIHLGYYQNIGSAKAARKLAEYMYGYHENHGAG